MATGTKLERSRVRWIIAAGVLALAGVVTVAQAGLFDGILKKSPAEMAKAAGVVETSDEVKIPLKSLDSGRALFLRNTLNGREIHYFALKSSDGRYRAAFDACDVCFRANRGYRQEGDLSICNQCGQSFPSVKINEVKGGCNPAPLTRQVAGSYLVIKKSDLSTGKEYFPGKRS